MGSRKTIDQIEAEIEIIAALLRETRSALETQPQDASLLCWAAQLGMEIELRRLLALSLAGWKHDLLQ